MPALIHYRSMDVPSFGDLMNRDANNATDERDKMILSAVSLLSVTEEYRELTLEQCYARIAAGADVDIEV